MSTFKPTDISQKLQALVDQIPAPLSWIVPDPYNPASYIMPVGGLVKGVGKGGAARKFSKGPFGGIFEDIGTQFKPGPEQGIMQPITTKIKDVSPKGFKFGAQLGGMNWRPVAETLDEFLK